MTVMAAGNGLGATKRATTHGFGRYAIVLRGTGDPIGDCGLAPTRVEGILEVELGWIVAKSH